MYVCNLELHTLILSFHFSYIASLVNPSLIVSLSYTLLSFPFFGGGGGRVVLGKSFSCVSVAE
jgi:hypothetical protein